MPSKEKNAIVPTTYESRSIYRPYIQCSKPIPILLGRRVSQTRVKDRKIGGNDDVSRELRIGRIISTMFMYSDYFSPLIDSYDVNIGIINDDNNNNDIYSGDGGSKYISTTTRYIGSKTLFQKISFSRNTMTRIATVKLFVISHNHLMRGLYRLQEKEIELIHFNISSENIVYDELRGAPILFDYITSFQLSDIYSESEGCGDKFDYLSTYIYESVDGINSNNRSLDVFILSYIVNIIVSKQSATSRVDIRGSSISAKHISEMIDISKDFVTNRTNTIFLHVNEDEKNEFLSKWQQFIENFANMSIVNACDSLIIGWRYWDLYSISAMYISELPYDNGDSIWLSKYYALLKSVILSHPIMRNVTVVDISEKLLSDLSYIGNNDTILQYIDN